MTKHEEALKDPFIDAYLECLFFVAPDAEDDAFSELGVYDIDASSLETIVRDCTEFQAKNETLIYRALRRNDDSGQQYSMRRVAHDFCYSRSGHGTGFWDRLEGPIGKQLSKRAEAFGEQNLYESNGKLYVG